MTLSKLLERSGSRVRLRAAVRNPSGSAVAVSLVRNPKAPDQFIRAFHLLVGNGVGGRKAKEVVDGLAAGDAVELIVPKVADYAAFAAELRHCGLTVDLHAPPTLNVAALREKYRLTQEQFAARFGLGLHTVQNWEQGRSVPDGPARAFLAVIDRYPHIAEEVVKAGG